MQEPLRSNVTSHHSRSTVSAIGTEIDEATDEELVKLVNDEKKRIRVINLENEILERTILRLDPTLMHGVYQAFEYATRSHSNTSLPDSFMKSALSKITGIETLQGASRMGVSPAKVSSRKLDSISKIGTTVIHGHGPKINILERAEIVSVEMHVMANHLEKCRQKAVKEHNLLKAQVEEVEIRVTDINKASNLFYQEVKVAGRDKITQRIPAEIWVRFMTEWGKKTDTYIDKLRLRTSTLNTQYAKLKSETKVKTELSESLRPVDFEKIKIENIKCLERIQKTKEQLKDLKKMTGDTNLTLAVHKEALLDQNKYLAKVIVTKKDKIQQVQELNKESDSIQIQVNILAEKINEIRKVKAAYEVPDVFNYVNVKCVLAGLKNAIKLLENRVRVQQAELASANRKIRTLECKMEKRSLLEHS